MKVLLTQQQKDLEQQLAAAKHSSALARVEIAREEKLLVDAQEELEDLERNAKAEQKAQSRRERGVCSPEYDERHTDRHRHLSSGRILAMRGQMAKRKLV